MSTTPTPTPVPSILAPEVRTLLAVDGNNIINRAFYALHGMTASDGLPTNALLGFCTMILGAIQTCSPDAVAVAWDLPAPTFRHAMYDGYKAHRKGMPDELARQLPFAKQLAELMGWRSLSAEGYEADDILGTVSKHAGEGRAVLLLTGDRDCLQLIGGGTVVLLASNSGAARTDAAKFAEDYGGLQPSAMVELKALMGDSSDEIPGVPGIGKVTAQSLIAEYGSIDALYAALDANAPKSKLSASVTQKLLAGRGSAYMSRTLSQINRDVPFELMFEPSELPLRARGIDHDGLMQLLERLGFKSIIKRLDLENESPLPPVDKGDEPEGQRDQAALAALYMAVTELPFAPEARLAAVFRHDGKIYIRDSAAVRCTINSDDKALCARLFGGGYRLTLHDCKAAYRYLLAHGIGAEGGAVQFDTMLAAYLLSPTDGAYGIAALCRRFLHSSAEQLEPWEQCELLPGLREVQAALLEASGMEKLAREIELPLARVLAQMEAVGFEVDVPGLREYGAQLESEAAALQDEIYAQCGVMFNINSPKQLGEVLFERLGLPSAKKTKSGYSTDVDVLSKLEKYHPVPGLVLEWRALSKLRSTYCEGLAAAAVAPQPHSPGGGRVHSTFNQCVTATGRLSSTDPNLQNIPVRTETGRRLREFFIAGAVDGETDTLLLDADYSQIELRILAHMSGDPALQDAFRHNADIHRLTASQVFGCLPEAVTPEMRKAAKAVNFGIIYGISEHSLSEDLGITRAQAGEYIDGYFRTYPRVRAYLDETIEQARELGYVTTMFGRRREVPELRSPKKQIAAFGERVAMNTPIQGTAADIIKLAMINIAERLRREGLRSRLILQVHDELIFECVRDETERMLALVTEEMQGAAALDVPLVADVHVGRNWLEAKG